MRWIYISPHLDDAVLSAGGFIYEQTRAGMEVEAWTFMCGLPPTEELSDFAKVIHAQWGIPEVKDVITARRTEDVKATSIVGAKAFHFDYLDCIYRRGKNNEWLYSGISMDPHPEDDGLPAQIAESISARIKPDDQLVCQLALGSHVDHVIVRRAVELLKRPLIYDVDIPYLFNYPDELAPKTAGMKGTVHAVSEAGLKSWQDAIAAYSSQMAMLFNTPDAMRAKIRDYWAEHSGIRFWSFA
jgi:LmbE family N-acetylglucosaminyl deacetylase